MARSTKTEALTPAEVLRRLAAAAGDEVVLIGGQALAFWVAHYGLSVPQGVVAISADSDWLTGSAADRGVVQRFAQALQGGVQFPSERALTALVGQAYLDISDDEFINVDVMFSVVGIDSSAVFKRSVVVDMSGVVLRVMHPLDVLRSRLFNLHKHLEKQNTKGQMQLALAIDVGREFLRAEAKRLTGEASSVRSPIQPYVSEIERLAIEDAGQKVAARYGLHVADAIDPSLVPAGLFWEKRWPQLKTLMSADYAERFSCPSATHTSQTPYRRPRP